MFTELSISILQFVYIQNWISYSFLNNYVLFRSEVFMHTAAFAQSAQVLPQMTFPLGDFSFLFFF